MVGEWYNSSIMLYDLNNLYTNVETQSCIKKNTLLCQEIFYLCISHMYISIDMNSQIVIFYKFIGIAQD